MGKTDNQTTQKPKGIIQIHQLNQKKVHTGKHTIGLILYIVVFVMIIPIMLYKFKFFAILEGYLPNLDLIATLFVMARRIL